MLARLSRQSPARLIALGFALTILVGSLLLYLPCSIRSNVSITYMDALYTAASSVCVTGLAVVDARDTFSPFGQTVMAILIQIGGLGVTAMGAGVMIAAGKKVNLKGRNLIKEAMNLDSGKGLIRFVKTIFFTTLIIELTGAFLSFPIFRKDMPLPRAIGTSLFHSIASFNNAGFDILGGGTSLAPYRDHVMLNLITCALIFLGGIGFLVIQEFWTKRFSWKRLSMHTKVVLSTSAVLTIAGTVLLKLSEGKNLTLLSAFFHSVSTRTAGFSTVSLGDFSNAGLITVMVLMFIGASPGSTGGGIKTSTFFVLLAGIGSAATNREEKAFHYSIPADAFRKASVIAMMGFGIVLSSTFLLLMLEPQLTMRDALFEMVSAFGTAGLSTGITASLGTGARLLSILIMYIGRLGPMTIATLWYFNKGERVRFPEGNISVG